MGNRLEVSAHKKNKLMTRIVGKSRCLDPGSSDSEMLVFFILKSCVQSLFKQADKPARLVRIVCK